MSIKRIKNICRKISIHNDLDIVVARLKAREVARELGFGTVDQARISLAAGELARTLASSIQGEGEIVISGTNTNGQVGIQVVSTNPQQVETDPAPPDPNLAKKEIADALTLVDEYLVENQGEEGTRVTLMKWLS